MSASSYVFKLQDPCNLQTRGCTNGHLANMYHGLVHQLISSIKFIVVLALFWIFCYLWPILISLHLGHILGPTGILVAQ